MFTDHSPVVRTTRLVLLAALLAMVVGALVLAGWAFDIAVLKSILPGWVSMKANTAVCFILIGVALWLTARTSATFNPQRSILFPRLARVFGLLAGLIGLLTLSEYVFGWNPGIDQWLFREPADMVGTSHPGRMAPETALNFVLLSVALWLANGLRKARWIILASVIPCLLVAIFALAAILSFFTPGLGGYGWFGLTLMAMHTSILFAMLGMAVIAVSWQPDILQWSLNGHHCGVCLRHVMLAFIGLSASRSQLYMNEMNRQIVYGEHILSDISGLLVEVIDAQANARGYVISGDERFKTYYLEAQANSNVKLDALRKLVAGNPYQQQQFARIEAQVRAQLQWLQQAVDIERAGMTDAARSKMVTHGKNLMDNLRITLDQIESEHQQLIQQLKRELEDVARLTYRIIFIGALASLMIFLIVIFRLNFAVTERKQAEMSLRNSKSQLETVIENLTEGLVVSDLDGQILHFSRAALDLHGFATLDECRIHLTKFPDIFELSGMDGTVWPVDQWPLARVLRGENLHDLEVRVRHIRAGWQRIFSYGGTLVRDAGGQPLMAILTISDITERNQAEMDILTLNADLERRVWDRTEELNRTNAELMYANHAKDSFLTTMSHEIRTPLSGMLGMLELLSLTQLNSEQKKTLQAARESGNSLLRILSDILDWSKIEVGKLGLSPQATSLKLLLQEVVTTYSHVASAKRLALWQHVDVRLSPAHLVDSLRLSQILNNFVSNAIKFTKKGEVEVRAELLERSDGVEQVRFSVRDTGIGIDQEQQSSLFQDYTQATATTARMYGGTGLGLAISRRLLSLMQGRIDLVSAPGQGSTFSITLTLPVTEMEPDQSAAAGGDVSVQPIVRDGANVPTVLVVDDHPINLALLARQVELLGLRSISAEDGEAALALWREGGVSLVITDVHMPKMDGYELAAAIRSIEIAEARPRMPIIANTANALSEEIERCHAAGMDEVMVKPATLAKLRATLLHWLPELSDIAAATPVHEAAMEDADAPIDYAELRNIVPDRAGQIALLSNFQVHQHTDLDKLMEELDKGDLAGTALTAHRIKGASRMVGAKVLASAYAAIEQAAKQNDLEGARAAMHTLSAAVNRFETYLLEQTDTKGENL